MKKISERSSRGLAAKIFAVMIAFVALMLALVWTFQILLLGDIYEMIRMSELKRAAGKIEKTLDSSELQNIMNNISQDLDVCISLYDISGHVGRLDARSHIDSDCLIHNLAYDKLLQRLYDGAEKQKYYIERLNSAGYLEQDSPETIIMSRVVKGDDSDKMILINAEIAPVDATEKTLAAQLGFISVILVAIATALTFVISRRLARPIVAMNREAAKLSCGDYNVTFDGGGMRETEELADTLNYAAIELSKIDRMQKELIANISHDLRTPLTMIAGYSEVIRDIPGEATPENMQIIIDETNRLASLVSDMTELSRLTSGTQKLKFERFVLRDAIAETIERYKKLKERDGYTFVFEDDGEYYVKADKNRIFQVIYNLINNAINYSGDDKTVIIRQIVSEAGKIRIEVTDHGDGIPAELLPMIWERYYRANDHHRRGAVGTGLGLYIVKGILELHGADYGVRSTLGEGSTFYFELPVD